MARSPQSASSPNAPQSAGPMKYVLPDLPYDYAALEPHLSARILELHHDRHHKAYVDGANRAFEQLQEVRQSQDFARIAQLERALAFNASGHVLHSLYWQNLSPDGGGEPRGALATMIERDFGNFDGFRRQFTQVATTIMGSGWAALVWEPLSRRLATVQLHDHQSETVQGAVPLLVLDAWEHAFYLQYFNEKAKFVEASWNLFNWDDVGARLQAAQSADLRLARAAA